MTNWGEGDTLNIVVSGQVSYGKSTLINNFLDLDPSEQANTGKTGTAVTTAVHSYSKRKNGYLVNIFDTPGFSDPSTTNAKTLEELEEKARDFTVHLLLYCVSLRAGRVNDGDINAIRLITRIFGKKVWEHTVFVFTFANENCKVAMDKYKPFIQTLKSKVGDAMQKAGVGHCSLQFAEAGFKESNLILSNGSTTDWKMELLKQSLRQVKLEVTCCLLKVVLTNAEKESAKVEEGKKKSAYWKIGMGVAAGALIVGGLATGGALFGVAAAVVGTGTAVGAGAVGGIVGSVAGGMIGKKLSDKDKKEIDEILLLKYKMWEQQQKHRKGSK